MPKRTDIKKILVIGSGPIVIGQAGEFDYSGTQACRALLAEGYQVILVNNNPATIMTDPELATRVYMEPLVPEVLEQIIRRERPDAILPTVGGQTAINLAIALAERGVLARYGAPLIGAKEQALRLAEDRLRFQTAMRGAGVPTLRGELADSLEQAERILEHLGLPIIVRPSFTLGGQGGGIATDEATAKAIIAYGLEESPVHQVLLEESVAGWKEFELEVMRDGADNVVIICSIENFDPMGVHTGDSITVAPAQTLTDREYQRMRDLAIRVIRTVGVETGGANIQFAVHPRTGRLVVIEMNPRVSRSSALASKATGFPIAKIAAKLAVGYRLDELPNEITGTTRASFEPTIDYCVVKIPRFAFEKFPAASSELTPEMKSVGEVMAIGRTFKEALQKAIRSLEIGKPGLVAPDEGRWTLSDGELTARLAPQPGRILKLYGALLHGVSIRQLSQATGIDPWFLGQLQEIAELEGELHGQTLDSVSKALLRRAKRYGFSDEQLAAIWGESEESVHQRRRELEILPVYKTVDTCAAEFESRTPYLYSTYEPYDESSPSACPKVIILGGGPYRIGQGIEFDYCCCHAAYALKELGYETIMVNCNPETVSTDYDTADRLYFEPVTEEDVLRILAVEKPQGVIVQYGGQTPLNLAGALQEAGAPIWGTSPEQIDLAEDRGRFEALLQELDIPRPPGRSVFSLPEALRAAGELGYPVLVRPSYVLGGRAMVIARDEKALVRYMSEAVRVSPRHPVLIDRYLQGAIEVDVDAVADGRECAIAGIMQHIEPAGVHSGDSCCVLPSYSLGREVLDTIRRYTRQLAQRLGVIGLMNVQYAVQEDRVYVLEVNPRASRTVPFVSKATGVPWAKVGAWVMAGVGLGELGVTGEPKIEGFAVKAPVFPFERLGVDPVLGPEMKSTGEVMGLGESLGEAFAKTQMNMKTRLPLSGSVLLSVNRSERAKLIPIAARLHELGFHMLAAPATAAFLESEQLPLEVVEPGEGHPNLLDRLQAGGVDWVISTPLGNSVSYEDRLLRMSAMRHAVPYVTTLEGAEAALAGIEALRNRGLAIRALKPAVNLGRSLVKVRA